MTEQSDEIITSEEHAGRVKADLKLADAVPTRQWRWARASNPQLAAKFVNFYPPQGAGEAVFSVSDDGTVDILIYV